MLKRVHIIITLALAIALLSVSALAGTLVSDGAEQIYLGSGTYPYSPETGSRYISSRATESLYKSDEAYLFTQTDSFGRLTLKTAQTNVDDGRIYTRTVAALSFDPVYCQYDGVVYYVDASRPNTVMSYSPYTGRKTVAYRSSEDIEFIMNTVNGLAIDDGDGCGLYQAGRKRIVDMDYDPTGSTIRVFGDCQTEITSQGELFVMSEGEDEPNMVSSGVSGTWRDGEYVYYMQLYPTSARVSRYSLVNRRSSSVTRIYDRLGSSIVAVNGRVYMTDVNGAVTRYDMATGRTDKVLSAGDGEARLELAGKYVVVYSAETNLYRDLIDSEEPIVVYETVRRGSRGDVVQRLQQRLRDLGYLTSSADGVFGSGTERAVRLLQSDMGLDDTGVATEQFQKEVIEGNPPAYRQYVTLRYGDRGIRVESLVERLRELYYTKQEPVSEYDDDTADAVERFQSQMGYRGGGNSITASQQKALFRSGAEECEDYYTLERYDSAPVVKRLNRRLRTLGYISANHVNESYSSYTVKAVRNFQMNAGFEPDGIADPDTQYELFSEYAPTPSPKPTPTPTPVPTPDPDPTPDPTYGPIDPEQAVKDSVIQTMRTWMKNNLGGSFPSDYAVYTLQSRLAELGYMFDTDINSVYDHVTKRAVMQFQSDNGLNDNGNANKKTLAALFLSDF